MIIYQAKSKDNLVDFLFLNSSHLCLLNRAKKKAFAILSRSNYRLPVLQSGDRESMKIQVNNIIKVRIKEVLNNTS